jgi:hypothetical protein
MSSSFAAKRLVFAISPTSSISLLPCAKVWRGHTFVGDARLRSPLAIAGLIEGKRASRKSRGRSRNRSAAHPY